MPFEDKFPPQGMTHLEQECHDLQALTANMEDLGPEALIEMAESVLTGSWLRGGRPLTRIRRNASTSDLANALEEWARRLQRGGDQALSELDEEDRHFKKLGIPVPGEEDARILFEISEILRALAGRLSH